MEKVNVNRLPLEINGKMYEWLNQYISGAEIRNLGKIGNDEDILLAIKRPWEDELIKDSTKIDLARPGIEHFYSKKHGGHFQITINVNGRPKDWSERIISYEQVVKLAFDNYTENDTTLYTVNYTNGPGQNPEGSMVKGVEKYVKNDMIFNVSATNRS